MDKLLQEFAAVGIAQALPGLRRMRQVTLAAMDAEIAKLQALLEQVGGISPAPARGRPKKQSQAIQQAIAAAGNGSGSGLKDYWAKMTPEERTAEMRRRMAMRKTVMAEEPMIGGKYTVSGVAKEFGKTMGAVRQLAARCSIAGKRVSPPKGLGGVERIVFTAAEVEKMRQRCAPAGKA